MKKRDRKNFILSILVMPIFFSGIFASLSPCKEQPPASVALEFWGVFDDSDVFQSLIAKFKKAYPYISVSYREVNGTSYEKDLIDALAADRGPDILMIHNTWLPKHGEILSPAPEGSISVSAFQDSFVDVAAQDFIDKQGNIYAVPLGVDSLALFYNKDLFNAAGIATPPQNWQEFNSVVKTLTKRDEAGNILQAGAAIGTARNINRSTDILALLMLQGGAKMVSDDGDTVTFDETVTTAKGENINPAEQAMQYYTGFADPFKDIYTWNNVQHYSLDAFVEGKAAMTLNYAYQIPILRARAPHLNFDVAPLPQASDDGRATTYANYWGAAVSKNSPNATYAWQFLLWLAGSDNQKEYLSAAKKPTSRRDLVDWQKNDMDLGVFAKQALTARCWRQPNNSAVETIFADAIDKVVSRQKTVTEAIAEAHDKIELLMQAE